MGLSDKRLRELASNMATAMGAKPRAKESLKITLPPAFVERAIYRDAMLGRIRDLRNMYDLGWLIRQETFGRGQLEYLEDQALSALLAMMEKARECIRDNVPFEDQDLIRCSTFGD